VWGVRGLGVAGRLSWRLFLPIHLNTEQVSWTTRSVGEVEPGKRYLTAGVKESRMNPKALLYGEDLARHAIVVVEGPLDAMRIGPGAVATLGLKVSRAQVLRMSKYPVRVVLFDSEPQAQRTARKLCRDLEVFPGATYRVEVESGKDPGECSQGEIDEIRKRFLD
jgi:DNA primase